MSSSESLARIIPFRLKPLLRILLRYRHQLRSRRLLIRNPIKERKIRLAQQRLLRENYSPETEKLIVVLTPGYDIVNGGILAISAIYEETTKLKHIHGAEVIMCTMPGHPSLLRYTKFDNQNYIYRFSQVLSYFQSLRNLMIHIPVIYIHLFLRNITNEERLRLSKIRNVHINLMIMNITLLKALDPIEYINELKQFGKVTCTTAHEQYTTSEIRGKLGIPLHKLSVWVSPEQYNKERYTGKENLMVVSPDRHPKKAEVLSLLARQLPQLKIQIIENLTYDEYKNVISRAKWALTFGEGLDGYFVESIFSGGVSFSVFNPNFFTTDFKSLRTVYGNYDIMCEQLFSDMKDLDNEVNYNGYQKKQYDLCCKYYNYEQFITNLELFYKGEYTFP